MVPSAAPDTRVVIYAGYPGGEVKAPPAARVVTRPTSAVDPDPRPQRDPVGAVAEETAVRAKSTRHPQRRGVPGQVAVQQTSDVTVCARVGEGVAVEGRR